MLAPRTLQEESPAEGRAAPDSSEHAPLTHESSGVQGAKFCFLTPSSSCSVVAGGVRDTSKALKVSFRKK